MTIRRVAGLLLFVLGWPLTAGAAWHSFSHTAMTTRITLEFWHEEAEQAAVIAQSVFDLFDRIDKQMNRYDPESEISHVNREAVKKPVVVSESLFTVLRQAQRVSRLSDGAFDISFGSIGYLYDYRADKQPDESQLKAALPAVDYRRIRLDPGPPSVRLERPGMKLDLGGIAKGYAVDQGIELLKREGIEHARLSAGGDMRLLGDRGGRPWIVGIQDPRSEERQAVVLPLSDEALSTSGDYERFFIDEAGNRVHHILSPQTGRPAKGIQSVSVLGPDALTTDGLSTAVFVLGVEKGLEMINGLDGIEAIIIDANRKMHYSSGLVPPSAQQE